MRKFPANEPGKERGWSLLCGAVLTLAVLLLLPLSQFISQSGTEEQWEIRPEATMVTPPPPPEEEQESIEAASSREVPTPDIDPPPQTVSMNQLSVALNLQPDRNLLRTESVLGLADGIGTAEEIRRFTFADLDGGPRVIRVPPVSIPAGLARRGFSRGSVTFYIRIERDGSVEVLDVVNSSHPELIEPARRSAQRARFEPPMVQGENVEIYGNWPLVIESI